MTDSETVHDIFVPGRLCILGEHTDWIASYRQKADEEVHYCEGIALPKLEKGVCIVCATNEGLYARCWKQHCHQPTLSMITFECTDNNGNTKSFESSLHLDDLLTHASKGYKYT